MEEQKVRRPALKVLPGGGGGEERALQRLLGQRHGWLLKLGAACAVLAAGVFLLIPAFSRRAPIITAEEVAAAMAASDGLGPMMDGLVVVLDLEPKQALGVKKTLEAYDEVARAPRQAREAALAVLRGAASGTGAEAAAVDLALVQRRRTQAQLESLDAELVDAVSAGLSPSQKARTAIILGHYLQRGGAEAHAAATAGSGSVTAPDARRAGPTAPPPAARPTGSAAPATTAPAARP